MSNFFEIYLACAGGIAISVILPILARFLPGSTGGGGLAGGESWLTRVWRVAQPYVVTGLFSALAALLIVAFLAEQLTDWRAALLAGYASDSTLQKIRNQ